MIITKSKPFTKEEIQQLKNTFEIYIKTVIDLDKKICSAGSKVHADSEKLLLQQGSSQKDLWGGGIDTETKIVTFNSFINIRPIQNNTSNEIQDQNVRNKFEEVSKYFFKELFE